MKWVAKTLQIAEKDLGLFFKLLLHSFFLGIFISVYFSTANSEFLAHFGSENLPLGYIFSGILGYFAVQLYTRVIKQKSGYTTFLLTLSAFLVFTALCLIGVHLFDESVVKWIAALLFLLAMPFVSLVGMELGALTFSVFDFSQGKKLIGAVGIGSTIASILGYSSIPLLLPFLDSRLDLLLLAISGVIGGIITLIFLAKNSTEIKQAPTLEENTAQEKAQKDISLKVLLKSNYNYWLILCGGISMMALYFIDFSFLINVRTEFENDHDKLAGFLGGFFGAIKAGEFILSLLSARIFQRFGLKFGIIGLPVLCMIFVTWIITTGNLGSISNLFIIVLLMKFFEWTFRRALEEPTFKILFQPIPAKTRLAVQAKIEGVSKQFFVIFAGIILYSISGLEIDGVKVLFYVMIPLFAFWIFASLRLSQAYSSQLHSILHSQTVPKPNLFPLEFVREHTITNQLNSIRFLDQFLGISIHKEKEDLKPTSKNIEQSENSRNILIETPLLISPDASSIIETINNQDITHNNLEELSEYFKNANNVDDELYKKAELILQNTNSFTVQNLAIECIVAAKNEIKSELLLKLTNHHNLNVRRLAFQGLERINFKSSLQSGTIFRAALEDVIQDYTYLIRLHKLIPSVEEDKDLHEAILEEVKHLKYQVLSILGWNYDSKSIAVIKETLFGDNEDKNSSYLALELIDSLIDNEFKPLVLPLFEEHSSAWKYRRLNSHYHLEELSYRTALEDMMNRDYPKIDVWIKACALITINRIGLEKSLQVVKSYKFHPEPFLKQLANDLLTKKSDWENVIERLNSLKSSKLFTGFRTYQLIPLVRSMKVISGPNNLISLDEYLTIITKGSFDYSGGNELDLSSGLISNNKVIQKLQLNEDSMIYTISVDEFSNVLSASSELVEQFLKERN